MKSEVMTNPPQNTLINNEIEEGVRRRLEIPADARRVLILAESSHWDPN
jgi:hypothetical protein